MDLATPVGVIVAIIIMCVSYTLEGGHPAVIVSHPSPILLVIGGTMVVCLAGNRMTDIGGLVKATLRHVLPGKAAPDAAEEIGRLMTLADTARRDGLLALEEEVAKVEDPFLKRGLELVVDGSDTDVVVETLGKDIDALRERHKVAAKFWADAGAFAPTLGIIGTTLGLIHALEGLEDPSGLGKSIAIAFLATLWGVGSANLFFLPLSNKMKRTSALEVAHREMLLEGVLAVQAGSPPRALAERLKSHIAPAKREAVPDKAAPAKAA